MRPSLVVASLLLSLSACVSVQTKDTMRDVINRRHAQCQRAVATLWFRDENTFEYYRCDKEEDEYCALAGLEKRCGEWQWAHGAY